MTSQLSGQSNRQGYGNLQNHQTHGPRSTDKCGSYNLITVHPKTMILFRATNYPALTHHSNASEYFHDNADRFKASVMHFAISSGQEVQSTSKHILLDFNVPKQLVSRYS